MNVKCITSARKFLRALLREIVLLSDDKYHFPIKKSDAQKLIIWSITNMELGHIFGPHLPLPTVDIRRRLRLRVRTLLPKSIVLIRSEIFSESELYPVSDPTDISRYIRPASYSAGIPNEFMGKGINGSGLRNSIGSILDQ
jgi:hypothetical protein